MRRSAIPAAVVSATWGEVSLAVSAAQVAKSCPASSTRPRGGGCGSSLAGRARPVAGPLARHRQSTGLLVSGLSLDEPGQLGTGTGLGVRDEAGRVLLHQAVQRGLLGAVAFVVKRGAVRFVPSAEGAPSSVLLWSDRRLQGDEIEAVDVAAGS